jgi:hypothetical protein
MKSDKEIKGLIGVDPRSSTAGTLFFQLWAGMGTGELSSQG